MWFFNSIKETSNTAQIGHDVQNKIDSISANVRDLVYNIKRLFNANDEFDSAIQSIKFELKTIQEEISKLKTSAKSEKKEKRKRIANSYADTKYANAYAIAMGYQLAGMKQSDIATKLNALGYITPTGHEFKQGNISDLLGNTCQMKAYLKGKSKTPVN